MRQMQCKSHTHTHTHTRASAGCTCVHGFQELLTASDAGQFLYPLSGFSRTGAWLEDSAAAPSNNMTMELLLQSGASVRLAASRRFGAEISNFLRFVLPRDYSDLTSHNDAPPTAFSIVVAQCSDFMDVKLSEGHSAG